VRQDREPLERTILVVWTAASAVGVGGQSRLGWPVVRRLAYRGFIITPAYMRSSLDAREFAAVDCVVGSAAVG
jgi:hypothetical protein